MFPERTDLPRAQVRWRLCFIAAAELVIATWGPWTRRSRVPC